MSDWKQTNIFTLAYDTLEYPKSFYVWILEGYWKKKEISSKASQIESGVISYGCVAVT